MILKIWWLTPKMTNNANDSLILLQKPTAKDPNLFSFLSPLSVGVWIYMATSYLAVSLVLYILAR